MANTLTNLIPDAYAALDVVSRELVGFIPSVTRDPTADRVAIGQNVRVPQTRANGAGKNITAAMALPSAADQTIDNAPIQITKARAFPFSWSGEERYAMDQGPGSLSLNQQQIAQAIRAAVNEIEIDLAAAAAAGGSRAYGTSTATPFASTLADSAQVRKILDDNGAPLSDRSLVLNTAAGANLRTLLTNPLTANASLTSDLTRQGVILDVNGFKIRESAGIGTTTAGTGTGHLVNKAGGYTVGETEIALDTGTGTILVGDVVTIGSHKYVVTKALGGGTIEIAAPGLVADVADDATVQVSASGVRNAAFSRDAIVLAARLPELPVEGDLAIDRYTVTDPVSGLSFEIAAYPGYRMITYEVALCWGVKALKPEHIAILLG